MERIIHKVILEGRRIFYEIKDTGCWYVTNFNPNKLPNGEVGYYLIRTSPGIRQYIHRMIKGSPKNLLIRHTCDDKLCINPEHLQEGDYVDNAEDALAVGTWIKKECKRGHDLTIEGSTRRVYRSGRRPHNTCRECEKLRRKQYSS